MQSKSNHFSKLCQFRSIYQCDFFCKELDSFCHRIGLVSPLPFNHPVSVYQFHLLSLGFIPSGSLLNKALSADSTSSIAPPGLPRGDRLEFARVAYTNSATHSAIRKIDSQSRELKSCQ